ncbi:MAG: ABC transporter ATP-binding protein [Candidatus Omnitrophota bacterium]
MPEPLFELKDVAFSYMGKFPALCGVDMAIGKAEKISILGANGTGKSTLLQLLDGLIFPDRGRIRAFGRELNEKVFLEEAFSRFFRSRVGFIFQNSDAQLFCPTVKEDIIFGPLQLGIAKEEIEKRFDKLTDLLGLKDLIHRSPHQLSIGEKRKVAIASTLIMEPQVIILDEPTAGLDPFTSRQIIDIVMEAHLEGRTVITATHDLHIVEEISDTVYVLGRTKKIIRSAAARELLEDIPFLKENNLVHIHSHRHKDKIHIHPHLHQHERDHHSAG